MSTETQTQIEKNPVGNLCWFEIPANDLNRAKKFYGELFGWKIAEMPGMSDYLHIDTGGAEESLDGGMMVRKSPGQPITNYVFVESVREQAAKVEQLGGKVLVPETAVPQMGYFAICQDTESNVFGLWQRSTEATS